MHQWKSWWFESKLCKQIKWNLYSINIYITDAWIQTEIKNILYYYKIISQDYEINDKPHVNLVKFKTNTNRKSDLFKAINDGVEEIV